MTKLWKCCGCIWGCTRFSAVDFGEVFCTAPIRCGFTLCLAAPHFWKIKTGLHKVRLILATGCCSCGYMGWTFKNYYSKFWAFGPLKNSILSPFWLLLNWVFLYQVSTTTKQNLNLSQDSQHSKSNTQL